MIREDDYLDTLMSLNVIEHIEDDRAALERFRRALKPSGRLILSFPALSWLYGPIENSVPMPLGPTLILRADRAR